MIMSRIIAKIEFVLIVGLILIALVFAVMTAMVKLEVGPYAITQEVYGDSNDPTWINCTRCSRDFATNASFMQHECSPPVYGEGELPTEWQQYFGTDNAARLGYMQSGRINEQGQAMAELAERVRKLENGK